MKELKKYLRFILLIFGVVLITVLQHHPLSQFWLGLCVLFVFIIPLFEFIESSRKRRVKKWNEHRPGKIAQILKFIFMLGLPISAIIIFLIHNKANIYYSIIFIAVPIFILFGWIGLSDWKELEKKYLEEKYKVSLKR